MILRAWYPGGCRLCGGGAKLEARIAANESEGNKIRWGARRGRPPFPDPREIIHVVDDVDNEENVKESKLEERYCEKDKKEKDRDQESPLESVRVDDIKENLKGLTLQEENCKEDINRSQNCVLESSNKEDTLDLEKMTLGQWFDYMDVHLQKQIIEETEMLIEGMRQKAERVHAYMMQQKTTKAKEKEKGKGRNVV